MTIPESSNTPELLPRPNAGQLKLIDTEGVELVRSLQVAAYNREVLPILDREARRVKTEEFTAGMPDMISDYLTEKSVAEYDPYRAEYARILREFSIDNVNDIEWRVGELDADGDRSATVPSGRYRARQMYEQFIQQTIADDAPETGDKRAHWNDLSNEERELTLREAHAEKPLRDELHSARETARTARDAEATARTEAGAARAAETAALAEADRLREERERRDAEIQEQTETAKRRKRKILLGAGAVVGAGVLIGVAAFLNYKYGYSPEGLPLMEVPGSDISPGSDSEGVVPELPPTDAQLAPDRSLEANDLFDGSGGSTEFTAEGQEDFSNWVDGRSVQQGDTVWGLSEEYLQQEGINNPSDYQVDAVKDQALEDFQEEGIADEKGWIYTGDVIDTVPGDGNSADSGSNETRDDNTIFDSDEDDSSEARSDAGTNNESDGAETNTDANDGGTISTGFESWDGGGFPPDAWLSTYGISINGDSLSLRGDISMQTLAAGMNIPQAQLTNQLNGWFGLDLSETSSAATLEAGTYRIGQGANANTDMKEYLSRLAWK